MPTFYYYILAAELAVNPYTTSPDVTTENCSLYFNKDTVVVEITASRGGNILRERNELGFKVFCNAAASHADIKNEYVLTWYKEHKLQFPMFSLLATIIFSIPTSQAVY